MDEKLIVFVFVLLFCWAVCVPLTCYGAYQIYIRRRSQIILKRHPTITLVSCVFSLLATGVYSPLFLCGFTFAEDSNMVIFYNYTSPLLFPIITYSLFYLLFLRFWALYFDIKWMQSSRSAEWKSFLSMDSVKSDWFLNNKKTFGDVNYVYKLLLVPWAISVIFLSTFEYVRVFVYSDSVTVQLLWSALNFLCFATPTFTMIFVWLKTPKFQDPFHIVYESLVSFRSIAIMLSTYMLVAASTMLGASIYTRHLLGCIYGILWYLWLALYYTLYAVRITKTDQYRRTSKNSIDSGTVASTSVPSPSSTSESTGIAMETTKRISIDDQMSNILSSDESFDEFIKHLSNEFSSELLLCFVELVQFKSSIRENESMVIPAHQASVLVSDFIPDSFIVHGELEEVIKNFNENNRDSLTMLDNYDASMIRAHLLYRKYMSPGSELQINLSHTQFSALRNQLSFNKDGSVLKLSDLFEIFDEALKEIWKLQRYSFYRFKRLDIYQTLTSQ